MKTLRTVMRKVKRDELNFSKAGGKKNRKDSEVLFFWSSSLDVARKPSLNALFVCQISYSSEDNLSNILNSFKRMTSKKGSMLEKCLKVKKINYTKDIYNKLLSIYKF